MSHKIITYKNFVKVLNETIHSLNIGNIRKFYNVYLHKEMRQYLKYKIK